MRNLYEIHSDYAAIYIRGVGNTYVTKVDIEDLPKILEFPNTWRATRNSSTGQIYVKGTIQGTEVLLHRYLFGKLELRDIIDHKNHDTLDNRRSCNLRVTDSTGNNWNKSAHKTNLTGIRGVTLTRNGTYLAQVKKNGDRLLRKTYRDIISATMAVVACRNNVDQCPVRTPIQVGN